MEIKTKFELGDRLRCRISGLVGMADQFRVFINGCHQYSIQQSGIDKDGKIKTSYWIDEAQLEFIDKGLNAKAPVKTSTVGGPTEVNNSRD